MIEITKTLNTNLFKEHERIEIGDIGKFFKEEHEDLLRLAVLTLDTRIKTVSPVDCRSFSYGLAACRK